MENKTKLTVGVIIGLAMLLAAGTGGYYISQDDNAYYCEAKDMVMICERLSSGLGTRCYFYSEELGRETYKICSEGWVEIETGEEVNVETLVPSDVPSPTPGKKWLCSHEKCVRIE